MNEYETYQWEAVLRTLANSLPLTEEACERVFAIFDYAEKRDCLKTIALKVLDEQRNFTFDNEGTIHYRRHA